jgi:hypothetical protein
MHRSFPWSTPVALLRVIQRHTGKVNPARAVVQRQHEVIQWNS